VEVWIHKTGWITPRFIEVPIQVNTMSTSGDIVDIGTWLLICLLDVLSILLV